MVDNNHNKLYYLNGILKEKDEFSYSNSQVSF